MFQTNAQAEVQNHLVAAGYTVDRYDDGGDYVPIGMDPSTGEWRDIDLDADEVVEADMTQADTGFTWADEDRVRFMFGEGGS